VQAVRPVSRHRAQVAEGRKYFHSQSVSQEDTHGSILIVNHRENLSLMLRQVFIHSLFFVDKFKLRHRIRAAIDCLIFWERIFVATAVVVAVAAATETTTVGSLPLIIQFSEIDRV
jgi:hypothetical protein